MAAAECDAMQTESVQETFGRAIVIKTEVEDTADSEDDLTTANPDVEGFVMNDFPTVKTECDRTAHVDLSKVKVEGDVCGCECANVTANGNGKLPKKGKVGRRSKRKKKVGEDDAGTPGKSIRTDQDEAAPSTDCDIGFEDIRRTRRKKITKTKSFGCELCTSRFISAYALKRHFKIHTKDKPFACELCKFRGREAADVKHHIMTVHDKVKPYKCDLCDFEFGRFGNLKAHMRVHTGEKPFACEVCDFKCGQASVLKRHNYSHFGVKPFACDFCEFRCTRAENMRTHAMTHTGEMPHSCGLCDYQCARVSSLRNHMLTFHSDEKPFVCDVCGYGSKWKGDLKKHKQRKHERESAEESEA